MRTAAWALVAAAACADAEPSVSIRWSMNGLPCAEAGVKTVHVFIGPLGPGSYDYDIDCELGERGVELSRLSPGPHSLVLKGFGGERTRYWLTTEIDLPAGGGDLGVVVLEPYVDP